MKGICKAIPLRKNGNHWHSLDATFRHGAHFVAFALESEEHTLLGIEFKENGTVVRRPPSFGPPLLIDGKLLVISVENTLNHQDLPQSHDFTLKILRNGIGGAPADDASGTIRNEP